MASAEIHSWRTISGAQPPIKRPLEASGQTFIPGTPVMISLAGPSKGFLIAWDGVTIANGLAGFSLAPASNLTTNGTAKQQTIANNPVPNQSSAVKIPVGAPANDGKCGIETAAPDTVFFGECGPAQTVVQTDIGQSYGMSIDADNHWFVDKNKTGASALVKIVDIDANVNTVSSDNRGFYFTVLPASAQVVS